MKYWEDFRSKYGFEDGDAVPPDAEAVRSVYIRKINEKAVALGSKVRLFAYDRSGMHNCFLIMRVLASDVAGIDPRKLCLGTSQYDEASWTASRQWVEPEPDQAMADAIAYYQDTGDEDIDELVESVVTILDEEDPTQTKLTPAQKQQLDNAMAAIDTCMRNALRPFVNTKLTKAQRQRMLTALSEIVDTFIEPNFNVTFEETEDPNVLDMTIERSFKIKD